MCGILFSSRRIQNLEKTIKFLKERGPDHTEHLIVNNFHFVHVLLSMTGRNFTIQPFLYENENIVIVFNGEIYNFQEFGNFNSDGECIFEAYKKYKDDFVKHLDGEFAIVLVDFSKNCLYYSTDVFSTKPLWIANDGNDFGICSYQSPLKNLNYSNTQQVDANSTTKIELSTWKILKQQNVYTFDLQQYKNSLSDWNYAFEQAIIKRTRNVKHKIFIGLSAGYDSGMISCVLNKFNISYTAHSILGNENHDMIRQRHALLESGKLYDLSQNEFNNHRQILKDKSEKYLMKIENGEKENYVRSLMKQNKEQAQKFLNLYQFRMLGQCVSKDNGSIGMSFICAHARKNNQIIYLSGSGADEILSDYGFKGVKHYGHSTIGGMFPEKLENVFPWKNFFGNTQRAYLMKEETVSGAWGIEGRYPFLDKQVVQEFLWLVPELKNQHYKAPIYFYLKEHNYPFEQEIKTGFNCGFQGERQNYKKRVKQQNETDNTPVGFKKNNRTDLLVNFDESQQITDFITKNKITFT